MLNLYFKYQHFGNIMKFLSYIILFTLLSIVKSIAADGDRTIVRTIEFQERRAGWYDFPDDSKSYQQVLLHFKLRCPPNKPCGEWDYLSYVFLNQWYAPNFRVNKQVVENFSYMNDTSWNYKQIEVNGSKVIEKTAKTPVLVEFYEDELNPTKVTDSIMVWPQYYSNYEFDDNGKAIDSVLVPADESIALWKWLGFRRRYYLDL
jgi:hypothetical protein